MDCKYKISESGKPKDKANFFPSHLKYHFEEHKHLPSELRASWGKSYLSHDRNTPPRDRHSCRGGETEPESSASAGANCGFTAARLTTLPLAPGPLAQAVSAAAPVAEPPTGFTSGALERLCDFFHFEAIAKVSLLLSNLKQFISTAFISRANTHRLLKLLCVSQVYIFLIPISPWELNSQFDSFSSVERSNNNLHYGGCIVHLSKKETASTRSVDLRD